jgi:nucleoid DNA-binding protein
MESKTKAMNKRYIVARLRERGLSRRDAVHFLNAVLAEMAAALKRGEEVEAPFGYLKRVPHARKKQHGLFLNKITTIYKKPYTVVLEVDADGEELLKETKKVHRRLELPPRPGGGLQLPPRPTLTGRPIGRKPLDLDREAILRDRQRGQSLGQLAQTYSASRATIHRVLHEHAPTTQE